MYKRATKSMHFRNAFPGRMHTLASRSFAGLERLTERFAHAAVQLTFDVVHERRGERLLAVGRQFSAGVLDDRRDDRRLGLAFGRLDHVDRHADVDAADGERRLAGHRGRGFALVQLVVEPAGQTVDGHPHVGGHRTGGYFGRHLFQLVFDVGETADHRCANAVRLAGDAREIPVRVVLEQYIWADGLPYGRGRVTVRVPDHAVGHLLEQDVFDKMPEKKKLISFVTACQKRI